MRDSRNLIEQPFGRVGRWVFRLFAIAVRGAGSPLLFQVIDGFCLEI